MIMSATLQATHSLTLLICLDEVLLESEPCSCSEPQIAMTVE